MSVYSTLKNDAGVIAITTQIFVTQAQNKTPPYVVIELINGNPENLLAEVPNMESQNWSIDCIGLDQRSCIDLYKACRDALAPVGYEGGLLINGQQDKETKFFRSLFDFSYWANR